MTADLSVIIVNWNSSGYLRNCLQSLRNSSEILNIEVIVLDNASFDGCNKVIAEIMPETIFIQMEQNRGFAVANNLGAQQASSEILLFLNPDTVVKPGSLDRMLKVCRLTDEAGAVGCRLLNSDGSIQTSCIKAFPTVINQILDAECLRRLYPGARLWGMKPLFSNTKKPQPVEVITGACLMMRRDVFEQIGGFCEDYFMYSEDVDLCFRANSNGNINYFVPDATIVHHGGGSSSQRDENQFADIQMRKSIYLFFKKHRSPALAEQYRKSIGISALVRILILKVFGRKMQNSIPKWQSIRRWAAVKP